jgi:mRNA interferase RelE/StbE
LERIWKAVQILKENPRPPSARKLRHPAIGEYRLRVGDWRVFYDIDEENKAIVILRVMHRREAYRSR